MEESQEIYNFVIKVKCGNKLKRIRGHSHDHIMNYNISKLRTEITSLFNISLDADLSLTYIDEDGDEVALDSDHELIDAVLNQQLNPLRINVDLKSDDISFSDYKSDPAAILKLTNLVSGLLKHASLESVSHSEPCRITEHEAAEMDAIFGQSSKSESSDEKVTSLKNNEVNPFFLATAASTSTESNFKNKSGNTDFNSMFLDSLYLANNYKEIYEPIETAPSAPEVPLIDVPSNYSMVDDLPSETIDDKLYVERTLLRELDNLGFKQIALNTEVLRQNQYDLEQTVDDLCDYSELGVLLSELRDMGFHDNDLNKKLLILNQGSIKQTVMDLVSRETNV